MMTSFQHTVSPQSICVCTEDQERVCVCIRVRVYVRMCYMLHVRVSIVTEDVSSLRTDRCWHQISVTSVVMTYPSPPGSFPITHNVLTTTNSLLKNMPCLLKHDKYNTKNEMHSVVLFKSLLQLLKKHGYEFSCFWVCSFEWMLHMKFQDRDL